MRSIRIAALAAALLAGCGNAGPPAEPLAGTSDPPPPHATAAEQGIDAGALAAAADYAGARKSRALIVARHGHIVFEKYWDGSDFATPVNTGEFNGAVTVLALGIAVDDRKVPFMDDAMRETLYTNPRAVVPMLEKATGQPYAGFLSQRLWKRLGAGDASLALDRCCLIARQGDWIRVGELLMNDGVYQGDELVSPRWVREMVTPAKSNPNLGVQVWLGSKEFAADGVRYLQGEGKNRLWTVPSLGLVILRTGSDPGSDWDETYIPNTVIHGLRDFVPRAPGPGETKLRDIVPSH